jgi:predicted RNA binding protein YcfA (HicA-like mRNA interferase family)
MNAQRLPSLKARDVIRALQKGGFSIVRTSGTLRSIINQADLTVDEFIDLL